MKAVFIILLSTFAYEVAECSIANFLADRALTKMSTWVESEGSTWVTLSGYFEGGIVQGQTNFNYTLAFAGPAFELSGSLSRTSDAILTDVVPDPNYDSSQKLVFDVAVKNVTINYSHVAYNDDDYGFYNITSTATSDGLSTTLTIDLKGSGDSCMGFVNDATVNFTGAVYVATGGSKRSFPKVIDAVTNHFKNNVPNAIGLLMKTATFNSLDGYDICTGVYNPLPEANVMSLRIMNAMQDGLNQNIQYWAELPGFWRSDTNQDGTPSDQVVVRPGNFSSIGTLRRIGEATYSNSADSEWTYLNFVVETESMSVMYGNVLYTTNLAQYDLAVKVDAQRMTTSMSFTFYQAPGAGKPSCVDASLGAVAHYEGGKVEVTSLTPNVPLDVLLKISDEVTEGFLNNLSGGAEDLFLSAAKYATTLGDATYSNNGNSTFLNFTIETDKVTGFYGNIKYSTSKTVQYNLGEQVEAGKIRTSYSVEFLTAVGRMRPLCSGAAHYATSEYVTGDEVEFTLIGSDIPISAIQSLYNLMKQGFLETINGAAEDLMVNLGKATFANVCSD